MKKLLTILVLIMLIISFFQITSMYALYKEEVADNYSTLLGAWLIQVNDTLVTDGGQVINFEITDGQLEYVESEYIQADKIAPNGQAYFDIEIDPSYASVYTDVSIMYTLDLGATATGSNGTSIANLELVSAENYFKINNEDEDETAITNENDYTDGNTYISVIPVDKITQGYKNYIRVYFKWVNVDDNDETDAQLGSSEIITEEEAEDGTITTTTTSATISVPVQINLKQYMTGDVIGNESE